MALRLRFTVDGTPHELDVNKLTLGEGRAIEKVCGETFAAMAKTLTEGNASLTTFQALVWVAMKRAQPTLRFSELDDRPMGDIEVERIDDDQPPGDADPTQASPKEPKRQKASSRNG